MTLAIVPTTKSIHRRACDDRESYSPHSPDLALARVQPPADPDIFIAAMWMIFCCAPRKVKPEIDGSYWLGEIGQDREKDWERLTPYSIARRAK